MRVLVRGFAELCAAALPFAEPIYEFGSLQVPGQEGFADLRQLFPGKQYIGADICPGPGADTILNLHELDLPSESVGSAILLDTLEHVEYPQRALSEVYRTLSPGGFVILSSVMKFPIHAYPNDYWRFTPEAFRSMLRPFAWSFVEFAGAAEFPHTIVGVACKGNPPPAAIAALTIGVEQWKRNEQRRRTGWRGTLKHLLPPLVLQAYRRVRRTSLHSEAD